RLARTRLAGQDGQARPQLDVRAADDAEVVDADLLDHAVTSGGVGRWAFRADGRGALGRPRHPSTGSPNLFTRRVVNGAGVSRARRTGMPLRVISTRDPVGTSRRRRPSSVTSPGA